MVKKKLNLTYISNKSIRKRAFKQRKGGFLKKLNDLKILCDVDACAVIYNPFNSNPEVWPSKSGVNDVVEKLLMETEKKSKLVNHKEFLNQYISKAETQKQKMIEDNKEKFLKEVMFKCLGGNMGDFYMNDNDRSELCKFIDRYLKNLYRHKNITLNNPSFEIGESSSTATITNMATSHVVDVSIAPTHVSPFMVPPTMAEVSSSFFLSSHSFFNSPQPTNEVRFIVSPNHILENMNSLASNIYFSGDQEIYIPAMNQSMIPSNQGAAYVDFQTSSFFSSNNQEAYIPTMDQEEVYYPNQDYNENQQQKFIEEMMNFPQETSFSWRVDNHHYNHSQF